MIIVMKKVSKKVQSTKESKYISLNGNMLNKIKGGGGGGGRYDGACDPPSTDNACRPACGNLLTKVTDFIE